MLKSGVKPRLISLLFFAFACGPSPTPVQFLNPNDYDSSCVIDDDCIAVRTSRERCNLMAINVSEEDRAHADRGALEAEGISLCSYGADPISAALCEEETCVFAEND